MRDPLPTQLLSCFLRLQDLASVLEHTLDLPSILPHGARVDPTADGFLIWLPTCESPCRLACSVHRLRPYCMTF